MRIERLDPDVSSTAEVRAWYDARLAAAKLDLPHDPPPGWRDHLGSLRHGFGGEPQEVWTARVEGRFVGGYVLGLPRHDNTHTGRLGLLVHPDDRRRGHGRVLLSHALDRLRAEHRTTVIGEAFDGTAGETFAEAVGATRALREVRRVLDLDRVDQEESADLLAEAERASSGYGLIRWSGPVPEEHMTDVVGLMARMSDAPTDDLSWEVESWDADRVRAVERAVAARYQRPYTIAARHRASGQLVGLTTVFVKGDHPWWSAQGDTVVLPPHRGRRLGLRMKLAMLPWLCDREPEVRHLVTWNAATNVPMVAVNDVMGYRVLDHASSWQLAVP